MKPYNARHLLENYYEYMSRRSAGDLDAVDALLDLKRALGMAGLTPHQQFIVTAHYMSGYPQSEIARMRQTTQQAVSKSISQSIRKVQKIFDGWEYE